MTSTNHVLSGALIAAVLPLPIALPVAFISHFILDALPHYGIPLKKRDRSSLYQLIVFSDTLLAVVIVLAMMLLRQWKFFVCGIAAYSPDFSWVLAYFRQGKTLNITTNNKFLKFHRAIQQFERPWGIFVEVALFTLMFPLLIQRLAHP